MLKQNVYQVRPESESTEITRTDQPDSTLLGRMSARPQHPRGAAAKPGSLARFGIAVAAALALIIGVAGPAQADVPEAPGSQASQTSEASDTSGANSAEPAAASAPSAAQLAAEKKAKALKKAKAAKKAKALNKAKALKKKKARIKKKRKKFVVSALKQVGAYQDCTRVVERALHYAGIKTGDLGTQVYEYTSLGGKRVKKGGLRPGDVLIWPGRHVAVYTGKGKAVHGGWSAGRTVKNKTLVMGVKPIVVRYFDLKV